MRLDATSTAIQPHFLLHASGLLSEAVAGAHARFFDPLGR